MKKRLTRASSVPSGKLLLKPAPRSPRSSPVPSHETLPKFGLDLSRMPIGQPAEHSAPGVPARTPLIQRKPAPDAAAGGGAAPLPRTDIRKAGDCWLVSVGGIAVAEVAVHREDATLSINVDVNETDVLVTVRHMGSAALAPAVNPGATLKQRVSLREIDMRQGRPGQSGPREPPVTGASDPTLVEVRVAPSSALYIPDDSVVPGVINRETPAVVVPPGALSEFERALRTQPDLINGVVLDPDTPGEIIGYRQFATAGVSRFLDREGSLVGMTEIGIEQPLVDPLDLIPTPGSAAKVSAGVVGRVGLKAATRKAVTGGTQLSLGAIVRMRGVSKALFGRALRKGAKEAPGFVRRITEGGLNHSFDRHAAQWFGREVSRETHHVLWRELIECAASSTKIFPWSTGSSKTIGHLARIDGKWFVVQFFEETGELATAFVPNSGQLTQMLRLLK